MQTHFRKTRPGALLALALALVFRAPAKDITPPDIILDEERVNLLGIDVDSLVPVTQDTFPEKIFALGRIEVLPGKRAIVSTRIAGRAKTVIGIEDMKCDAGNELLWVESRQPGDPPPVIPVEAPIGGIIAKVNVAPGQPIEPTDTLMEIYDLSTVEAVAAVPEHLAGKLAKDQDVTVTLPGYPGRKWETKLAHVGVTADTAAGTLEAAVHIQNDDEVLRPGMRAEFYITTATREDIMQIPRAALQGDAGGYYVLVKHYELPYSFWKRPVVVGAMTDDVVEIVSSPLNLGDEVVTKGAYALAFAGKGNVSLKEVLDAAHGHEHNEDGSEMTPAQKATREAAKAAAAGKTSDSGGGGNDLLWKIIAAVLGVLLVVQSIRNRHHTAGPDKPSPPPPSVPPAPSGEASHA